MSDAFYGNGMAFSAKSSTAANKLLCIRIMPTVCSHQILSFAKKKIGTKNSKFGRPFGAAFFSKVQANTKCPTAVGQRATAVGGRATAVGQSRHPDSLGDLAAFAGII